mgnify:FL=1
MALSYNLEVETLQNLQYLSQALISLGQETAFTSIFGPVGEQRFSNSSGVKDIYPTGEYIIRKGMYINGMFVYVGSYKAYCVDLFGAGNNGYAWDGFIMVFRGYNLNQGVPLIELNPNTNKYEPSLGFGFLPMRMMFQVNGGGSGDATAIAGDSSVGLHSMDIFKDLDDITVTDSDTSIRIITCGFQRINPAVEGVPTGMDYVGNIYMGLLLTSLGIQSLSGNDVKSQGWLFDSSNMMQITWNATNAGNGDNTGALSAFMLRDLDEFFSVGFFQAGAEYSFADWRNGETPATNPAGDVRAKTFNYFPRRFLDVACFSTTSISATLSAGSPFYIVGDLSLDTNNDGSVDDTCPFIAGCSYQLPEFRLAITNTAPYSLLGPYMMAHPSITTSISASTDIAWWIEDTAVAYSLSGSVASLITIPYENTSSINYEALPISLIAVNNVSHSGTEYGDIFALWDSPVNSNCDIWSYAAETGGFTTATGISLANKFYNKAIQFRTFTLEEEGIGKQGTVNTETGVFTPSSDSIYDFDVGEYIGNIGNYQRYGSFTNPLAPNQPQGTLSGAGYGFLGAKTGTGPIAIMFDSGSPKHTDKVGGSQDYNLVSLAEGANLNSNHIIDPTSTTRSIVQCGWDNDRDQWLFMTSNSTGVGVISASSDFSTASNNVGFLDQTATFPVPSTVTAGMYSPITMSNSMDGWTFFGVLDTDTDVRFGIKPPTLGSATTITVSVDGAIPFNISYDVYYDNASYFYRIIGTTGRTARVWIDYVLYDGVDSVIAKKLRDYGIKVNIDNVEWFKRKIIRSGDLNIKSEEIEEWMRAQQTQYTDMLKDKERNGRIRKRKSQVSAYIEGVEEQINPDFMDSEVKDHLDEFIPQSRPPSEQDRKREKKRKGGYEPETKSYYDDVFDDTE